MSAKKEVTVEELQAEVDRLRVMCFGWSYEPREMIALVTKAIGRSIDGFGFETSEAHFGKPGRIEVDGKTEDGKEWHVELAITRIDEIDNDADWDGEDE